MKKELVLEQIRIEVRKALIETYRTENSLELEVLEEKLSLKGLVTAAALGANLFLGSPAVAQTSPTPTTQVSKQDIKPSSTPSVSAIVKVDSTLKKATLYANALTFFANAFKSANAVIQMKDAETGRVVGKGIVKGHGLLDDLDITISIICKDGRYKYDIYATRTPDTDLKINNYGVWYGGKTTAILDEYGKYIDVVFTPDDYRIPTIHIDGSKKPLGTDNAFGKWKEKVREVAKFKADKQKPYEDEVIASIIQQLYNEMTKGNADW